MQLQLSKIVASLLVAAVSVAVTPAFAHSHSAQPQCGDDKKGDTKDDKKDDKGDTKPKSPSLR